MKVHRIITTIEVENDNHSMTTVELTKLYPADDCILLAITDITTNGSAKDINQVYTVINEYRCDISNKLKDIVNLVNDSCKVRLFELQ